MRAPCSYLVASHTDNTLTLYMVRSTDTSLTIEPGQRLWGHTSGVHTVQVSGRGKAVSISNEGMELRVWELEGGVSDRRRINASVKVEPISPCRADDADPRICSNGISMFSPRAKGILAGFDDEKVVILRKHSSMVPDPDSEEDNDATITTVVDAPPSAEQTVTRKSRLALVVYDFTR